MATPQVEKSSELLWATSFLATPNCSTIMFGAMGTMQVKMNWSVKTAYETTKAMKAFEERKLEFGSFIL